MAYAIPTVMTRTAFRPKSPLMSPVKPIYKAIYVHGFELHLVGAHLVYIYYIYIIYIYT